MAGCSRHTRQMGRASSCFTVAGTRTGTLSTSGFLLRAGFTVLTPDCGGHGGSGGSLINYGVQEVGGVHAWADWIFERRPIERLYGWGASVGAAILLESLPVEPRNPRRGGRFRIRNLRRSGV
jgi:hypothetical protein